jgi:hypothetical protein
VTEKLVWHVVKEFATRIGNDRLAPPDLRRTCARLCRAAGGELEQIQFLLGHVSVQTTERYLGCIQRISAAVNHKIGIEPTLSWRELWKGAGHCIRRRWSINTVAFLQESSESRVDGHAIWDILVIPQA